MAEERSTVVFMGSPDFAVPTLDALLSAPDFDVVAVVSQPDRPKGRGKRTAPTPVRARAHAAGISTHQMSRANYADVELELRRVAPEFIVVAAFGIILKRDLLALPPGGCVNLHASLLPRHRGVSPIQAAIMAGDRETGCTTMFMDEGIDTGDILLAERTDVVPADTSGELEARLASLGAPLVVRTLRGLRSGEVTPVPQDESLATYTKKIRKRDGRIDWSRPAAELERHIRAMSPWPAAYTHWEGRRLIVTGAAAEGSDSGGSPPGTVVSTDPFLVATGGGALRLVRVKLEGKKELAARDFLAGSRMQQGTLLA